MAATSMFASVQIFILLAVGPLAQAQDQPGPPDLTRVRPGPARVESAPGELRVTWPDENGRAWQVVFALDARPALIRSISVAGKEVLQNLHPVYSAETGIRRGGWDQFFDFPPSHPEGTRRFQGVFRPGTALARSVGDRLEIEFPGMTMGSFSGKLVYTIYPGSRMLRQEAVLSTTQPNTAYFYDAGIDFQPAADRIPGNNMESYASWYEAGGPSPHTERIPVTSERTPVAVRSRAIAAKATNGSIAVFPPPHQYFFARDYTSNMGYSWYRAWRGHVGLGIRQLPDDNSPYYPWMNAPPGTEQHMSIFLMVSDGPAPRTLNDAVALTRGDHFVALPGFRTMATHFHFAFSEQANAGGARWSPPWKPVLHEMGINAAMIMDFHGDLHPQDPGPLRFPELKEYYEMCRAHSTPDFLIIPAEEANVYLGGHWALAFPKPVLWSMKRPAGADFKAEDPGYGTVYRTGSSTDLLDLIRAENAFVYQTHPRTKGSTGFPDKILDEPWFKDNHYQGTGWKAMPSDMSSPRLGERAFKLIDDLANQGFRKKMFGEVDVFQLDNTHELYAHMNVNYLKMNEMPAWDDYSKMTEALARGDGFITTGEILLPDVRCKTSPVGVQVSVQAQWTFPLNMAEIVWGDGKETHRKIIDLSITRQYGSQHFDWSLDEPGWKWARLAIWDIAGDGAFTNPVYR